MPYNLTLVLKTIPLSRRSLQLLLFLFTLGASTAFCQPYLITTVAGTNRLLDGHAAASVPLRSPLSVALDNQGNLYIADRDDNRVRKVAAGSNIITTIAGVGLPGYTGDRGKASVATLASPSGLAVDTLGNVYIADVDNYAVRRVSPDGTINTVAGNGTPGFSGDNGAATSAQLQPLAVAVDSQGNLYIADELNNRVRKVDTRGIITTIAGNGQFGYSGDSSSAVSTAIDIPTGLAVDAGGDVYVAAGYERVLEITPAGAIADVAGTGYGYIIDGGDARQSIVSPLGVALDGKGTLFLSDLYSNKIRRVDLVSHIIFSAAGNGSMGFSGDGGPALSAEFNTPAGIALDAAGDLFVADFGNNRVRKISNSTITTVVGVPDGDGGPATSAFLNLPLGLAIDGANNIVVADNDNFSVRRFSLGGIIGPFGQLPLFNRPFAVAVDSSGNFYASDDEPRVLKITPLNVTTIVAGNGTDGYTGDTTPAISAEISQATGLAVDPAGNIYLADDTHYRIRKITPAGIINTIAGNGNIAFSGDNGPALNAGMDPYDIAVDSKSNLYVADRFNNRIRKISPSGTITTVAGTGIGGFSGDGGLATLAKLFNPTGVAVDSQGNLYIADDLFVHRVTPSGLITTIAGTGILFPSTGDGGPAMAAQMNPVRLAVDSIGNVYVSDFFNDRIRKLAPQPIIPAALSIVSGNNQQGNTGAVLSAPLMIKVTDRNGAGLAGVLINFTVTPGTGATLSLPQAITLNDGTAQTGVTLGSTAGTVTVTASASGVSSVSFSLTVTTPIAPPSISSGGVVSAGLSTPTVSALSVNSIATVFGNQFAPAGTALQIGSSDLVNGNIPTAFGGVCVLFGSVRAPIFEVYSNQINVQVPQVGPGAVNVQVVAQCDTPQAQTSSPVSVQIQAAAPEFFYFTHAPNGHNAIAAVNAVTGAYVGAPGLISGASFSPANHGDYLTLYATGFGDTSPSFAPGALPNALAQVTAPVTISFGGVTLAPADILYVGLSQNAGLYQVNIRVPGGVPAGDQPLIITVGGVSSPPGAYITVASQ